MKISGFLAVVEKFWNRAAMFFPADGFADKVKLLSKAVRKALFDELRINYCTDAALPPQTDMGSKAEHALEELCRYLDEHDPGVNYRSLAGFPCDGQNRAN